MLGVLGAGTVAALPAACAGEPRINSMGIAFVTLPAGSLQMGEDGTVRHRWSGGLADEGRFLQDGKTEWFYPGGRRLSAARFARGRKTGSETFYRPEGTAAWRWQHEPDSRGI